MADQPVNPLGANPAGTSNAPSIPAGPARSAAQTSDGDLQAALDALSKAAPGVKEVSNLLRTVSDLVEKTEDNAEKISKRVQEWGSELRHVVATSNDIQDL